MSHDLKSVTAHDTADQRSHEQSPNDALPLSLRAGVQLGPIDTTLTPPSEIDVRVKDTTTHCAGLWAHRHLVTHKMSSGPLIIGVHVRCASQNRTFTRSHGTVLATPTVSVATLCTFARTSPGSRTPTAARRKRTLTRRLSAFWLQQANLIQVSVNLLHNASTQLVVGARAVDCDVTAALNVSFGPNEGAIEKDVIDLFLTLTKKELNSTLCDGIAKLVSNKNNLTFLPRVVCPCCARDVRVIACSA